MAQLAPRVARILLLLTALLSPASLGPIIAVVDGLAAPSTGARKGGGGGVGSGSFDERGGDRRRRRQTRTRREYNYFAYGSNMCSATMTALRGLNPIASTAAVLPNHELRFNVPGTPLVEPSWASVEPSAAAAEGDDDASASSAAVHGVLYRLTEEDFSSVLSSEGVPLGYSVHRCRAVPYRGDGKAAGADALRGAMAGGIGGGGGGGGGGVEMSSSSSLSSSPSARFVPAYTLRAARPTWRSGPDTPPSRSYLDVLIRGAEEFRLDQSYAEYLRGIEVGPTPLTPGGGGVAGTMLEAAERRKKAEVASRMRSRSRGNRPFR